MSKTVFTKVDYDLGSLVKYIGLGEIGLPDIQRPFVWKNAKVRDLFDSMYKGYPVGYFLFWQNALETDTRAIGTDHKQKSPRLVIVDGQQRLTSLYAVVNNVPVIRENFEGEKIQIAFNPIEERFEVADAAIKRDRAFIPDISILLNDKSSMFEVAQNYIANLDEANGELTRLIQNSIQKLAGLLAFPFTALELASDIDEEAVSDVFVRINSKGTPLNQSDFILTLMSVFWDDGRTALEQFCKDARIPARGNASPFNHYITPSPDQLLRVAVGIAFKRARLKYVYSILRGKDLETEKFSEERRIQQFDLLKNAQARVLNLQHWHDFMHCIRQAGFRSEKMVSSQNNLLFSYILYLIGRTEYKVVEFQLRLIIARWFFMSSVTGRFTGSPESAMESDLARLRNANTAEEFVQVLDQICSITLTNDFWNVTLPNDLATSSPRSPSLFAYHAALVLLNARALFSQSRVSDLLDPTVRANRAAVERHHLFPKEYLKRQGIAETRDTNQIANYAFVEWGDNAKIADQSPKDYLPALEARFSREDLALMYKQNGLTFNWEQLDYHDFLQERRELIAQLIRQAYETLAIPNFDLEKRGILNLTQMIEKGESDAIEFKSTLRTNLHTKAKDARMEHAVLKTLAGFFNTSGGTLIVGLTDDGSPIGIQADDFSNEDKMNLHLINLVKSRLGIGALSNLHAHFEDHDEYRVLVIKCQRAASPVFLKDGDIERFYIRTGPSTSELRASETQAFVAQRFR